MDIPNFIKDLADTVTFWVVSIPLLVGAGLLLISKFKKVAGEPLNSFLKKVVASINKMEEMQTQVTTLAETHNGIVTKVEEIHKQVFPNGGGSLRDEIQAMGAERHLEFYLNPQPMFDCNEQGQNVRVNRAYCDLFNITDPSEANRFNWVIFLNSEDRDAYVRDWTQAYTTKSTFSRKARFQDAGMNTLGILHAKAFPLFNKQGTFVKYRGYLEVVPLEDLPSDDCNDKN